MPQLFKTTVVSCTNIAPDTFVLEIEKVHPFMAGQIIGLTVDESIQPRLYSVCSAPAHKTVQILFNINPEGVLTPRLEKLNQGNRVFVTQPHGKFIYKNEPAWWIATGTGVAPFVSMFLAGQKPMKLIQGGRTADHIYFSDLFNALPDYIKCESRGQTSGYYHGRLTQYIAQLQNLPSNINYYICGGAEMVVDVRNLLIEKGVGFDKMITEIYF